MSQINLHHGDCMAAMREMPDKAYDLAIIDPPYDLFGQGFRRTKKAQNISRQRHPGIGKFAHVDAKTNLGGRPCGEYFQELMRISGNQIVWGCQYFLDFLHRTSCLVVWNKHNIEGLHFADIEVAWTSYATASRMVKLSATDISKNNNNRIHPTQKPVALYKWLLSKYAKAGDRILDTHGGSMSIAIACHDMGFDLDLWEIDEDYYRDGVKRFNAHTAQSKLFTPEEMYSK